MTTPSADADSLCIYCHNEAGSNEHAWPDWIGRFLRPIVYDSLTLDQQDEFDVQTSLTVDCVCDTCNRNWMKKLEDKSIPFLKSMMLGESVELDYKQTFTLRRWAVKTAISWECSHGPVSTSVDTRQRIRNGVTTRGAVVLLGRYSGRSLLSCLRVVYSDTLNNDVYMSWATLVIGQVLLHVLTDAHIRNPEVNIGGDRARHFVDVVPRKGVKINWPGNRDRVSDDILAVLEIGPHPDLQNAPYRPIE